MDLVGISTSRKAWSCWWIRSIIGIKVNYLKVGPGPRISGSICPSLTLLSTEIKLKYQPEEKEIDVVEELELYSLILSR